MPRNGIIIETRWIAIFSTETTPFQTSNFRLFETVMVAVQGEHAGIGIQTWITSCVPSTPVGNRTRITRWRSQVPVLRLQRPNLHVYMLVFLRALGRCGVPASGLNMESLVATPSCPASRATGDGGFVRGASNFFLKGTGGEEPLLIIYIKRQQREYKAYSRRNERERREKKQEQKGGNRKPEHQKD